MLKHHDLENGAKLEENTYQKLKADYSLTKSRRIRKMKWKFGSSNCIIFPASDYFFSSLYEKYQKRVRELKENLAKIMVEPILQPLDYLGIGRKLLLNSLGRPIVQVDYLPESDTSN